MSCKLRSKAILKVVGLAVFAAMFCVGCNDGDTGGVPDRTSTITFDPNGGEVDIKSAKTERSGRLAYLPTPTRAGYTFVGWYSTAADTGGKAIMLEYTGYFNGRDVTIYAHWEFAYYSITFDPHHGYVTPEHDTTGDDWKLSSLPVPTRNDHEFIGWYTDIVGEGEKVDESKVYRSDMTLYAHWVYSREHFKITFDPSGGTVDPASEETDAGGILEELPLPERDGYAFVGWYTAATGGELVTTDYPFSAAATIYAQWKAITNNMYKVTFDPHGGAVSPQFVWTGEDGKLLSALPIPTREGCTFLGWFTEDATITANTVFKTHTTVNAVWSIIHYTITLDPTGGDMEPTTLKTHAHWELLVDLPVPTRVGYTFTGWYTELSGGIHVTPATPLIGNRSIYAHWAENPPSLVDDRDGKAYKEVAIGEQIWMAENLNYASGSSVCYDNDPAHCDMYGRLYTWEDAKAACPVGWHLPSDAEWTELIDFITGLSSAGTAPILKSTTGWYKDKNTDFNGTDNYGFSALPGGQGTPDGKFYGDEKSGTGGDAFWWSSTERDGKPENAWLTGFNGGEMVPNMVHKYENDKRYLHSVRCLKD